MASGTCSTGWRELFQELVTKVCCGQTLREFVNGGYAYAMSDLYSNAKVEFWEVEQDLGRWSLVDSVGNPRGLAGKVLCFETANHLQTIYFPLLHARLQRKTIKAIHGRNIIIIYCSCISYIYIFIFIYLYIYIFIHLYIYIFYIFIYIYLHIYIFIYLYIYTYIHTHS